MICLFIITSLLFLSSLLFSGGDTGSISLFSLFALVADLISTNRVMTMMIAIMIPMINIFDYYDN